MDRCGRIGARLGEQRSEARIYEFLGDTLRDTDDARSTIIGGPGGQSDRRGEDRLYALYEHWCVEPVDTHKPFAAK
jgi:hypothetical protein